MLCEVGFSSLFWGTGSLKASIVAEYASEPFLGVDEGNALGDLEEVEVQR